MYVNDAREIVTLCQLLQVIPYLLSDATIPLLTRISHDFLDAKCEEHYGLRKQGKNHIQDYSWLIVYLVFYLLKGGNTHWRPCACLLGFELLCSLYRNSSSHLQNYTHL